MKLNSEIAPLLVVRVDIDADDANGCGVYYTERVTVYNQLVTEVSHLRL